MSRILFDPGQVTFTRGVQGALEAEIAAGSSAFEACSRLLYRHCTGDWGEMDDEDVATNNRAVREGKRLLSQYTLPRTKVKVWVITEWDRSVTTMLLPEEY